MFDITFYPATYGDCIWITYGPADNPFHILVDGGTAGTKDQITKKLKEVQEAGQQLELVVVSHIDRDHIEGILGIFKKFGGVFSTKDFWFNGWKHLDSYTEYEDFGSKQGEKVSAFLEETGTPWNKAFKSEAVVISDPKKLPVKKLAGGMKITLLSPYHEQLAKLKSVWLKELLTAGLVPGQAEVEIPDESIWESFGSGVPKVEMLANEKFEEDGTAANGSSIALLLEYEDRKVLLAADAHPSIILRSLNTLSVGPLEIDLFKISHHGSHGNTSPELFAKAPALAHVFSTSGTKWPHPHQQTIARLLKSTGKDKILFFNYSSDVNKVWNNKLLKSKYRYDTTYGDNGLLTIEL